MMQIYSSESPKYSMQPKEETISLLLNFSKSLKIVKTKGFHIELILN